MFFTQKVGLKQWVEYFFIIIKMSTSLMSIMRSHFGNLTAATRYDLRLPLHIFLFRLPTELL